MNNCAAAYYIFHHSPRRYVDVKDKRKKKKDDDDDDNDQKEGNCTCGSQREEEEARRQSHTHNRYVCIEDDREREENTRSPSNPSFPSALVMFECLFECCQVSSVYVHRDASMCFVECPSDLSTMAEWCSSADD